MKKSSILVSLVAIMAVGAAHAAIPTSEWVKDQMQIKSNADLSVGTKTGGWISLKGTTGDVVIGDDGTISLGDNVAKQEDIAGLAGQIEDLSDLEDRVATNEDDIGDLKTKVGQNTNDIGDLKTKVGNSSVDSQIKGALTDYATKEYADGKATEAETAANSYTDTKVSNLKYDGAAGAGVLTQITQANGVITATKAQITDAEVAENAAIATSKIAGLDAKLTELGTATSDITELKQTVAGHTTDIGELKSGKQDSLSEAQLAAANSGITTEKVAKYEAYETGKQDKLSAGTAISLDDDTVSVLTGNGIDTTGGTVAVKAKANGGITVGTDGLAVDASKISLSDNSDFTGLKSKVENEETGLDATKKIADEAKETADANAGKIADATGSTTVTAGKVIASIEQTDGKITKINETTLNLANINMDGINEGQGTYVLTYSEGTWSLETIDRVAGSTQQ